MSNALLARGVLVAATVVTPLVVARGPVYGFDIPKLVAMAVTGAALLVLAAPGLPDLWRRSRREERALLALAAAFAVWVVITTLLSDTPRLSVLGPDGRFVGSHGMLAPVVLLLAVPVALRTRRHLDVGFTVLMATLSAAALYAVIQVLGLDPMPWGPSFGGRPVATFGNSNFVGAVLCVLVPLALWRWFRVPAQPAVAVAIGLVAVIALWRSEARLGWVAAATGVIAFALVLKDLPWRRMQGWLVAAIPVGTVFGGLAVVGVGIAIGDRTGLARRGYWSAALPMWADNALTGVGPGRFQAYHRAYRPPDAVIEGRRDIPVDSSHAWILDLGATLGTPGALLWLAVLVAAGLVLRRAWLDTTGQDRVVVTTLVAVLAAHGMQSSISVPTVTTVWLGWLVLGAVLAAAAIVREPEPGSGGGKGKRARSGAREGSRRKGAASSQRDGVVAVLAVGAAVVAAIPALQLWWTSVDLGRAFALRASDLHAESFVGYDVAAERSPWWPEPWRDRGVAADAVGDTAELRYSMERAIAADPRHREALGYMVELVAATEGTVEARPWFAQMREIDPNGLELHLDLAQWALAIGEEETAEEALDVAELSVTPELPQWERYQALRSQL